MALARSRLCGSWQLSGRHTGTKDNGTWLGFFCFFGAKNWPCPNRLERLHAITCSLVFGGPLCYQFTSKFCELDELTIIEYSDLPNWLTFAELYFLDACDLLSMER
jgi:hypothetical protein